MDINQLKIEYYKILEENNQLKEEILFLRKQLDSSNVEIIINENKPDYIVKEDTYEYENITEDENSNNSVVSKYSSSATKIELYLSLFRGRPDICAKQWKSKDGRIGYSPYCYNDWAKGLCYKQTIKCTNCKNQNFATLNANEIEKHLLGKQILGIYPLTTDDSCYFLAMDFDDEGWQDDLSVIRQICQENNISAYAERSRSGNGAHLWFFFEEKMKASIARKFGTTILTEAMDKSQRIGFDSYDRLFPSQDFLQKDGFGNLIALPLQGIARKSGNTEFVDNELVVYEDQWYYLGQIKKLSHRFVEAFLADHSNTSDLGVSVLTENKKPWENRKDNSLLTTTDFPTIVTIVKSNGLYIEKAGLSARAINRIKRLAVFSNPEFFAKQAMRMSTHNINRMITVFDETELYICIPRGVEVQLVQLLEQANVKYEFIDQRSHGRNIDVTFTGELLQEQRGI